MADTALRIVRPLPVEDPLVGRVLNGRFTLLEAIGVGGMGRVYRALQAPLNRVVAVKVLSPTFNVTKDPAFRERFTLEASLTAKLRHPNTISVIDYGQTGDGIFYIAMEMLEGQTLSALLNKEGTLPWARAVSIAQQICRSLREAHKLGIVHRDLKPANVMLLAQEADHDLVKVLDFGLVKPFTSDQPAPDVAVTQGGMFLGSPLYMAPEQAKNQSSPRSDIYSLGILLYHMIVGRPPFLAKDAIDIIVQHIKDPVPWIQSLRPDVEVPTEVEAVLRRCLEKDSTRRFASMDELLTALRRAAASAGGFEAFKALPGATSSVGSAPSSAPKPMFGSVLGSTSSLDFDIETPSALLAQQRQRRLAVAGAAGTGLLAALVLVGLVSMFRGGDEPPTAPAPGPLNAENVAAPVGASGEAAAEPGAAEISDAPLRAEPAVRAGQVRFRINTIPAGATVWKDKRKLGKTPLTFDVAADASGEAAADLTFQLEGYHPLSFTAAGYPPEVILVQRLAKKSEPVRVASEAKRSPPVAQASSSQPEPAPAAPAVAVAVTEGAATAEAPGRLRDPESASVEPAAAVSSVAASVAAAPEAASSTPPPASGLGAGAPASTVQLLSPEMERPELVSGDPPTYPREAHQARVEGTIIARCVVTLEGRLRECRLIRSLPYMTQPVLTSLATRRYRPAMLHGRPVPVDYMLYIKVVAPRS